MLEDVGDVPELLLRDPERALGIVDHGRPYCIRKAIFALLGGPGRTGCATMRIS